MKKLYFLLPLIFLFGYFAHSITQSKKVEVPTERVVEKTVEKPLDAQGFAFALYNLTNKEREKDLLWDNCLHIQAGERAKQLFDTGSRSHTDDSGKVLAWDFINKCVSPKTHAGENITWGHETPEQAEYGLINSPKHKENIVDKKYTKMGVGCFENVCVEFFSN